jgi:glyoxylase-like metal-dependent hydrolase (beta-lactamase superfamily II)
MSGISIHPLYLGTFPNVEKSIFTYACNQGIKFRACCIGWYLQGATQKILVDTGPSDLDLANRYHPHLGLNHKVPLGQALSKVGVTPEEIDIVIFTHLHWDHCHNLESLSHAKFFVQKEEIQYAVSPLPIHQVAYEVSTPGLFPAWMSVFDRMKVSDGDEGIIPGISVVGLPGHTPGFQGVIIETSRGRYLIAGDAIPLYENWENRIPSGIHVDLREYEKTFRKIDSLKLDGMIPGHDEKVFERGIIG